MYPQIVKVVITLFSCTSVINGTKYLMLDPEIECFQYNAFVWVGIVLGSVVYIIGMPAISIYIIKRIDRNDADNRLKYGI